MPVLSAGCGEHPGHSREAPPAHSSRLGWGEEGSWALFSFLITGVFMAPSCPLEGCCLLFKT